MADEAPQKRILFVNDEPDVLAGLRTRLRRYRTRWEMVFAGSGEEALRLFDEKPFDVIVSDLRMPKMGGAEYDGCSQKLLSLDSALVRNLDLGARLDAWRARAAELVG